MTDHPYRFWIAVLFAATCLGIVTWSLAQGHPGLENPPEQVPENIVPLPGIPRVLPGRVRTHIFSEWAESLHYNCKLDGGDLYFRYDDPGWIVYWCEINKEPEPKGPMT